MRKAFSKVAWASRPWIVPRRGCRDLRAFTLVELVVVIGLIVALAAGTSVLFRREGNAGLGLRAAQAEVAARLAFAQRTAGARQEATRLLLCAAVGVGEDPGRTRRHLQVVRRENSGWIEVGAETVLPAGICVVPPVVTAEHLRSGVTWGAGPVSVLDGPESVPAGEGAAYFIEFKPDGTVSGGARQIVLAVADTPAGQIPRLVEPTAVRSIRIDGSGRIGKGENL